MAIEECNAHLIQASKKKLNSSGIILRPVNFIQLSPDDVYLVSKDKK